jgi:hypothetical protein
MWLPRNVVPAYLQKARKDERLPKLGRPQLGGLRFNKFGHRTSHKASACGEEFGEFFGLP